MSAALYHVAGECPWLGRALESPHALEDPRPRASGH